MTPDERKAAAAEAKTKAKAFYAEERTRAEGLRAAATFHREKAEHLELQAKQIEEVLGVISRNYVLNGTAEPKLEYVPADDPAPEGSTGEAPRRVRIRLQPDVPEDEQSIRQRIDALLHRSHEHLTAKDIAAHLGVKLQTVASTLPTHAERFGWAHDEERPQGWFKKRRPLMAKKRPVSLEDVPE